ncbi:helix-turn-helix domain-containing protein [Enterobacteriaceae bacterium 89]|nr:helix-turn-helix domain-containing protein [Enterobacteriaceae bacterium 89]
MKPESHITQLIEAFSNPEKIQKGRDRQVFPMGHYQELMCFILHEGTVAAYKSDTHLLVSNIRAPFVIGLNALLDQNYDIYLQSRGPIRYELSPRAHCFEVIEKQQLWQHVAFMFMHATMSLTGNYFSSAGLSSYELVRNNLLELMECDAEMRLRINACDYIREKTHLSRSSVMKILADLKKGGYIDTRRGILIEIINLPKEY